MISKNDLLAAGAALALLAFGLALVNCASAGSTREAAQAATAPIAAADGAKLWAQNCGHCHNIRSPDSYSDAQWDVALLHMRVRANLTANEHAQILAFLKSAH